ncbi:hypothetical protein PCE1_003208 [Barthelona sp. PCE]
MNFYPAEFTSLGVELRINRRDFAFGQVDDCFVIFGGSAGQNLVNTLSHVSCDESEAAFTDIELPNLPSPRVYAAGCGVRTSSGPNMFFHGGRDTSSFLSDCMIYSPLEKAILPIAFQHVYQPNITRLPTLGYKWRLVRDKRFQLPALSGHSAASTNGLVFLFGGQMPSGKSSKLSNALHVVDLETLQWMIVETKNVPDPVTLHSSEIVGNNMYVFGGRTKNGVSDIIHKLDLSSMTWTIVSSFYKPQPRFHMSTFVIEKERTKLIGISGGLTTMGNAKQQIPLSDLWFFNTSNEEFFFIKTPSIQMNGHASLLFDSNASILLFDGLSSVSLSLLFDFEKPKKEDSSESVSLLMQQISDLKQADVSKSMAHQAAEHRLTSTISELEESIKVHELSKQQYNCDIAELHEQLLSIHQYADEQTEEVTSLTSKKASLESERDDLLSRLNSLSEVKSDVTKSIEELQSKIDLLQSERDSVQIDHDSMKNERDAIKNERDVVNEQFNSLKNERDSIEKQLNTTKTECINIKEECEQLKRQYQTVKHEAENNQADADEANQALFRISDEFEDFRLKAEDELIACNTEIATLQEANDTLHKTLASSTDDKDRMATLRTEFDNRIAALQDKLVEIDQQKTVVEQQLEAKNKKIASLENKLKASMEELENGKADLSSTLSELNSLNTMLDAMRMSHTDEISAVKQDAEKIHATELAKMEAALDELKLSYTDLEAKFESISSEKAKAEEAIAARDAKIVQLNEQSNEMEIKFKTHLADEIQLRETVEMQNVQLTDDLRLKGEALADKNEKIIDLTSAATNNEAEFKTQLADEIRLREETTLALEAKIDELTNAVSDVTARLTSETKLREETEAKIESIAETHNEALEALNLSHSATMANEKALHETKLTELEEKITEKDSEIENLTKSLKSSEVIFNNKCEQMQIHNETVCAGLKKEIIDKESKILKLNECFIESNNDIIRLNDEIIKLNDVIIQKNTVINEASSSIAERNATIDGLKSSKQALEEEFSTQLSDEIRMREEAAADFEAKIDALTTENAELHKSLTILEDNNKLQIATVEKEVEVVKQRADEADSMKDSIIDDLREEVNQLSVQIEKVKETAAVQNEKARKTSTDLRKELALVQAEKTELASDVESLVHKVGKHRTSADKLQKDLGFRNEEINSLKEELNVARNKAEDTTLSDKIRVLESDLTDLSDKYNVLKSQNIVLKTTISELEEANNTMLLESKENEHKFSVMSTGFAELTQEHQDLRTLHDDIKIDRDKLLTELQTAGDLLFELSEDNKLQLSKAETIWKEERDVLLLKNVSLQKEVDDAAALVSSVEGLEIFVQDLVSRMDHLGTVTQQQRDELKAIKIERDSIAEERQRISDDLRIVEAENIVIREEMIVKNSSYADMEERLAKFHETTMDSATEKDLHDEIDVLRADITAKDRSIDDLTVKFEEKDALLSYRENEMELATSAHAIEVENLKKRIRKDEKASDALHAKLKDTIDQQEHMLKMRDKEIIELRSDLQLAQGGKGCLCF